MVWQFVLAFFVGVLANVVDDDHFKNEVAPIFAARCASCHNDSDTKGGFSILTAETFFKGSHVEPGDSNASYLIELITSETSARPSMPRTGPPLTQSQIDSIKQWIDAGAEWPDGFSISPVQTTNFDWWSFNDLIRPEVPKFTEPKSNDWIHSPIDAFVLRKLQNLGLEPTEQADRRTLIRRVTYDLTGLPPSFEEIDAFVASRDPHAYEKLVDRLLASPRYGEHWARHWLDVVKYADTCGYDKDKLRPNAWPYRDYVIRSFNDDKPYRQFVQEQIAGDVLFPQSPDGVLGLGFIAAGPWDFIGHVEVPESKIDGKVARNLDRDDMVSNALNTFCSITVQCARCHDHKFDPFTQEHYYSLQSVFAAVDRAERVYDEDPKAKVTRKKLGDEFKAFETEFREIRERIENLGGEELKQMDAEIEAATQASLEQKPEFGYHSEIASDPDEEKWVAVKFDEPVEIAQIVLHPCMDDFAGIGAGFGFPVRFKVEVDGEVVVDHTDRDFENPGLSPVKFVKNRTASEVRIVATKLAERKDDFIFALAELEVLDENGDNVVDDATVESLDSIEMPVRWSRSNLNDGIWSTDPDQLIELSSAKRKREKLILKLVGQETVQRQMALELQITDAKSELEKLPLGKLVYAAATDFEPEGSFQPTGGKPREIRLLLRGNVTSPDKVVQPGVVPLSKDDTWLFQLDANTTEADRRAELARWLSNDANPLVWRSIANRIWHYHFGRGIVETPNDFGRMGSLPTHPELLDWLAVEFRETGGSFKHLHRLLVTSSVYRQASTHSESSAAKDSSNRFLWRMKRRRLSAEEIRDSILSVSGQLELKMGGPGYYLFNISKLEHSPHFEYQQFDHSDATTYRRSIYRFVVRSQPDPFMTTLDCADSSQSTPARSETQTALQSLTLMNNPFNLLMAEKLAERIRKESDSAGVQIKRAFEFTIGRQPTDDEQRLMAVYVGDHGLENLARVLFNLSEFLYVD